MILNHFTTLSALTKPLRYRVPAVSLGITELQLFIDFGLKLSWICSNLQDISRGPLRSLRSTNVISQCELAVPCFFQRFANTISQCELAVPWVFNTSRIHSHNVNWRSHEIFGASRRMQSRKVNSRSPGILKSRGEVRTVTVTAVMVASGPRKAMTREYHNNIII